VTSLPAARRRRSRPVLRTPAIVLRRSDFRESSRIVTCLTREHGRLVGLAKGAHRPDSPFLGRIDFLHEVIATFSADRGGLRLCERLELVRERRALRQPRRFLAASHLAQLSDFALPDERPEPWVYDLLVGGIALLEKCPEAAIPRIVLGLELRHLQGLGALPDLWHCTQCNGELREAFSALDAPGLACRDHAQPPRQRLADDVLHLLRELQQSTGRQWPELVASTVSIGLAAALTGRWLAAATEQRPRLRAWVFARGG
jgi:DNA repair protein RecO (recombination protein O)